MMKDVLLFLITFAVIMIAFACGVSFIFNMASGLSILSILPEIILFIYLCIVRTDQQGSGSATAGVFTYFFWVLLQPFRGNPEYKDVADLPYNTTCLAEISSDQTDINTLSMIFSIIHRLQLFLHPMTSLETCIVETLYNTSCILNLTTANYARITRKDIAGCLIDRDAGFG